MKRRILGLFTIFVTITLLGSSLCTAADVRVMYAIGAIGLLDNGENARLLTTEEFNQTVTDYDRFRSRVTHAPTLKAIVQNGWNIVHVQQIRAKGGEPYKELNYYLIIFQGGM